MAGEKVEQRAIALLRAVEKAGKTVSRVVVDGRRIELELASGESVDEFDRIDMRHGKA
jgi:phage gp29-like protein